MYIQQRNKFKNSLLRMVRKRKMQHCKKIKTEVKLKKKMFCCKQGRDETLINNKITKFLYFRFIQDLYLISEN